MEFAQKLEEYAQLIVNAGINAAADRYVTITCPVIAADFGCKIAEKFYKKGVKDVIMLYVDENFARVRYENVSVQTIGDIPAWQAERRNFYAREGCCNIAIIADDPEIFTGIDGEKLQTAAVAAHKAYKEFYDIMDKGGVRWTIVAYPNVKWAEKIFPALRGADAVNALWEKIFTAVRVGAGNAFDQWSAHDAVLKARAKKMNDYAFSYLHYTNALGTDLKVGLVKNHIWAGGSETDSDGVVYFPNMPTEEIFTMPDKDRVDGVVYSAMPLVYQGSIIDKFHIRFKNGRAEAFGAEKGEDILAAILNTDEGSRHLGEAALIPYESPISQMHILFYETLFDENASCHLALGDCYPNTVAGGESMTREALSAVGGNHSVNHVDFMIGTADTNIDGVQEDGTVIPVFRNGNFVF